MVAQGCSQTSRSLLKGGVLVGNQNQKHDDLNKDRTSQGGQTGEGEWKQGQGGQTSQADQEDWKKRQVQDDQSDVTSTEADQDPLLDRR
jgi:hypothetical protein